MRSNDRFRFALIGEGNEELHLQQRVTAEGLAETDLNRKTVVRPILAALREILIPWQAA